MSEQLEQPCDEQGKNAEESQEQMQHRIAQKCADLSDTLAKELLSVIDKHQKMISEDKELNAGIMFQIMSESVGAVAGPVIMSSADYTKRIAEIQALPDIGEASYLLAAQADFVNSVFSTVSGMAQHRALSKAQKSTLVGV